MDGDVKEAAVTRQRPTTARARLGVRLALGAAAAAACACAALAAVNLNAVYTYNQATRMLGENIAAAGADTPDYARLRTLQEQTDAQFDQAGAMAPVLLPQVREAIDANAEISDQLTRLTKLRLSEQQEGTGNAEQPQTPNGGTGGGDGESGAAGGGLTDEQRRQVEELLKANEQSTPAQSTTTDQQETDGQSSTTGNSGNSAKPW